MSMLYQNGWIQITSRCNLNCSYCYMNANSNHIDMTLEQFEFILKKFSKLGITTVMISGGEPCIHPQITKMIETARNRGFGVGLVTNGTYINEEIIRSVKANDGFIQVSVDALDEDSYVKSRGSNKLQDLFFNIDLLIGNDINFSLSSTFNDITIKQVQKIVEFALMKKIHTLHFCFLVPSDRCKKNDLKMNNLLDALTYLYHEQIEKYLQIQIGYIETIIRNIIYPNEYPYYCNCMAGKNIEICADGRIMQCGAMYKTCEEEHQCIHNIYDDEDVLEGNCFQAVSVCEVEHCKECEIKYICKGGCRAIAYQTNGSLYDKLPICEEMRYFIDRIREDQRKGKLDNYMKYLKLVDSISDKNSQIRYF